MKGIIIMKKKTVVNEEMMATLNNKYLEDELKRYLELKKLLNTKDVFDEYYEQLYSLIKILEYREVLVPALVTFLDNKLESAFNKGRLPEDFDYYNNDKIKYDPISVSIGEKGKNNHVKYIVVCTSLEKLDKIPGYTAIITTNVLDIMDRYFDGYNAIKGIIINPFEENFILDMHLCEIIKKNISREDWNAIKEKSLK